MKKRFWPVIITALLLFSGCSLPSINLFPQTGPLKEVVLEGYGEEKVLVISIDGTISDAPKEKLFRTSPGMVQDFVTQLRKAEKDPKIKAVLLKVNSPGGTATASDILYHEISAYKERTDTKLVVAMMDVAASGGYYLSLPADWIMAHPTTITGSVGVIFMRFGVDGFMEKHGFAMNVSKSGDQKDMGSPFREPSKTDTAIFQQLTDQMAQRFHGLVQKHRQLTSEQMKDVATARVYMADDAKAVGLIDEVGYLRDAIDKAKELAGLKKAAKVVTYRRLESKEDNIYKTTARTQSAEANASMPTLGGLMGIPDAGFYYIWPASIGNQ